MTYGAMINGPLMHYTYSKVLPFIAPGNSAIQILKKIIFTQTIFTFISMGTFYACMPLLQG